MSDSDLKAKEQKAWESILYNITEGGQRPTWEEVEDAMNEIVVTDCEEAA